MQQRDRRPAGPLRAASLCLCLVRYVCHGQPQTVPTLLPVLLLADSDAWALTVVLCLFEVFFEISICTLSWVSCAKRDACGWEWRGMMLSNGRCADLFA